VQKDDPVTGLPVQSLKISGNLGVFLSGKTVSVYLNKNDVQVATSTGTVDENGDIEIQISLSDSVSGVHSVKLTVDIDDNEKNIALPEEKKSVDIPTIADIVDLLNKLNSEPCEITDEELKNLILEEKDSLSFETSVFKHLDDSIKDEIISTVVEGSGYTASSLYDAYEENVIMKTASMSSNPADFERLAAAYADKTGISNSSLYNEYRSSNDKSGVFDIMLGATYLSYSDIVNQFEYSYCHRKLSTVANVDNILDVLDTYKSYLGVEAQVDTIRNKVDPEIKVINEGLGNALPTLKTKQLLISKINELIVNAPILSADKITPPQTPGFSGGGGGGGGGSTVKVEETFVEKPVLPEIAEGSEAFGDLGNVSWAAESINALYRRGIVSGKSVGRFCPGDNVTRAEFIKMILHAFNLNKPGKKCSFEDVPDTHWAYDYIANASEMGIVSGYSEKLFGVNNNITRQDTAAVVIRVIYKLSMYEKIENRKNPGVSYTDASEISSYALGGVNMLSGCGIFTGYEDGSFGPRNELTRAEAAVIIKRILDFFEI